MKGPWTYRRMVRRDDTQIVWPIYRLRDAAGEDVEANREYYTVCNVPVWSATEQGAQTYARIFNAVRHRDEQNVSVITSEASRKNDR